MIDSSNIQLPVISALIGGALVLAGAALTTRVIVGRVKYSVDFGHGDIDDLAQRIRAHGNFAEQAPLALLGLTLVELMGAPTGLVVVLGMALLLTRGMSAVGLSQHREQSSLRKSAAGLTQLLMLATGGTVVYLAAQQWL